MKIKRINEIRRKKKEYHIEIKQYQEEQAILYRMAVDGYQGKHDSVNMLPNVTCVAKKGWKECLETGIQ